MTPRPSDDDGFSLVEALVALAVLVVISVSVAGGLTTALRTSGTSRARVVAANLASQEIELVRALPQTALVLGVAPDKLIPVDALTYTVRRTVAWAPAINPPANRCLGAATGSYAFRRVSVVVTWPSMVGATPVTDETLLAPPGGSGTPDANTQRVRVLKADGTTATGAQASLTGPVTQGPLTVDSYGCVLFSGLPAGTYTLSVSKAGAVDPDGKTVVARAFAIAGAEPPPVIEARLDTPGSVTVQVGTPNASYPVPALVGASVSNTSLNTGSRSSFSSPTVSGLFPFSSSGYSGWAGPCADGSPSVYGKPLSAPVVVAPGGTASLNVGTGTMPLAIKVKTGNNPNATYDFKQMYAVHVSTAGCGLGTPNPGVTGGTVGAAIPVTTDGNGMLYVALPYGTWRFEPRAGSGYIYNSSGNSFRLAPFPCSAGFLCDTTPSTVTVYVV